MNSVPPARVLLVGSVGFEIELDALQELLEAFPPLDGCSLLPQARVALNLVKE
jgi:hypothetical protein